MTRGEKVEAMEALWEDLSRDEASISSPAWHGEALREAEEMLANGQAKFTDWQEVKARLQHDLLSAGEDQIS